MSSASSRSSETSQSSATSQLKGTASRAADSKPLEYLVRGGFVGYGVIHLLVAWLAIQIAFGHRGREGDQNGALQTLAGNGPGRFLLGAIAVGMVALAVWQAFEAALGESGPRDSTAIAERVISGVRAVIYLWLAWTAVRILRGASSNTAGKSQRRTSTIMSMTGGRFLVGVIGVVVLGVGIGLVVYGVTKKFQRHLNTQQMAAPVRAAIRRVGMVGYLAKGVAYAIVGVLVVAAAVTYDAGKARGLDSALKTLAAQTYGGWLLALVALGFVAFGGYCLAQAKYRKV